MDTEKLKALALAAYRADERTIAANPATVLDLIADNERLRAELANVLPPVAPKGPFADYSAEEVEAYAREYAESRQK